MMRLAVLLRVGALVAGLWPGLAAAQTDTVRAYVWGNPQLRHESGAADLSVLHWVARLAEAGGKSFAADGRSGDLRDHFAALPPESEWDMATVPRAWPDGLGFRRVGFDTLILAPPPVLAERPPADPDAPIATRPRPPGRSAALWAARAGARVPRVACQVPWVE